MSKTAFTPPICARLEAERWVKNDRHGASVYEDINPDGPEASAIIKALYEASRAASFAAFTHYRKPNGELGTIEGSDGEMCFIVPHDEMVELRAALTKATGQ